MPFVPPRHYGHPEILLAISDNSIIVSVVIAQIRQIQVVNMDSPLPYDVLTWINLLRRDDGGIPA